MKKFFRLFSIALSLALALSFFSVSKAASDDTVQSEAVSEESAPEDSVPIYRRYNPGNGEHFYTTNKAEADSLVTVHGWSDEGIGWYAPKLRADRGDPVYRFYNPVLGVHRYTADKTEREALLYYGWNAEGILCYSKKSGGSPVFRLKNPNNEQENFTLSPVEAVMNIRAGWLNEPYTFFAVKIEK